MISRATLGAVARGVAKRFAPERAALLTDLTEARSSDAFDAAAFAERMEDAADRHADAVVKAVRPLLTRVRLTPAGREVVDIALAQIRTETRNRLLPAGMTAADVRANLADAEAKDGEIFDLFAAALEDDT
ncbi:hypothetical protein T8K17_18050 [Thalassobaculum sp. OXR-137]|uniref:hypothetical protein n=1 Tax=Thalassobaculum sp. OXR-137 TaxID=3100173 RepID=UPI002AC94937|nr:hypothetical protein [Thalassobaculum sp. OXR-137]WPZ33134.1 hypothetical protein T8K17_18050 [Thalassobaculum sp. OXR-137]